MALNSPWDAVLHDGKLYVAMAGPHQIWVLDPRTREARPYAGSGREDHLDGSLEKAALAQPSGITTNGTHLFFADSEVSSIRAAALPPGNAVSTIVGKGLFDFGDVDGRGGSVRLQHPLGIVFADGKLYVADTYNSKIKEIDPVKSESHTYAGGRERGSHDGDRKSARFNEPGGISATSTALWVADTNNHLIRKIDLASGAVSTLELSGLEKMPVQAARKFRGRIVPAGKLAIGPGPGKIALSFTLPAGFKLNPNAPLYIAYGSDARNVTNPTFPLEVPVDTKAGENGLTIDAVVYFCRDDAVKLCMVDALRIQATLEVRNEAPNRLDLAIPVRVPLAKGF